MIASPMKASSRQRSSSRPSSPMRPQALPVPSVRAYQRESSSHHEARAHRLQVWPRIAHHAALQVDHHHAAGEKTVVARVPLDHGDAAAVGRERQTFDLPFGLVQRLDRARLEVEPGDHALVPTRARVVSRDDRDDGAVAVPVDLPHAEVRRTDLAGLTSCKVDQEQPPPRVARPAHDRIGPEAGAVHGTCAPVDAVRTWIGREHQ